MGLGDKGPEDKDLGAEVERLFPMASGDTRAYYVLRGRPSSQERRGHWGGRMRWDVELRAQSPESAQEE